MAIQPPLDEGTTLVGTASDPVDNRGWTPRLAFGMVAIVALLEMMAMGFLMISTALPFISAHYKTTQGAWMFTAFQLVGAVCCPLLGKLADMYGKRLVLLVCVTVATAGSLMSALAPTFSVMIAGRALAGFMVPCLFLSYSLIRDVFPPRSVAVAVSIATSGMGIVAIPAPFLTGYLLDNHGFRSIFWFMAVGLVIIGSVMLVCLDESTVRIRSKVDYVGAALIGGGIGGVLIAISFGPTWGWTAGSTITYLLAGILLLGLWVVSARVVAEPLIDLDVVRQRSVFLTAVGGGVVYGVSALFATLLPMMVMIPAVMGLGYGWGLSAEEYAVFQLPMVIAIIVGGLLVGFLVNRGIRPRFLMIFGLALMSVGLTLAGFNHSDRTTLILFAIILGFGQGLTYAAVPNLVIESVAPQLQATTASIVAVSQAIAPGVITVVAFAVLNNSHIAIVVNGVSFYDSSGFRNVMLLGAAIAVIGAMMAFALPRRIVQKQADGSDAVGARTA